MFLLSDHFLPQYLFLNVFSEIKDLAVLIYDMLMQMPIRRKAKVDDEWSLQIKKISKYFIFNFLSWITTLKVSVFGVILVRIFPPSDCIQRGRSISPYSVQMRENTDMNNFEYGHFSHSEYLTVITGVTRIILKFLIFKISFSDQPYDSSKFLAKMTILYQKWYLANLTNYSWPLPDMYS